MTERQLVALIAGLLMARSDRPPEYAVTRAREIVKETDKQLVSKLTSDSGVCWDPEELGHNV